MSLRKTNAMPSFDSFLDIVTNVVGVLVLVAIVTVVSSSGLEISLGTPMVRPAPEKSQRISLDCRGNGILQINEKELGELFEQAVLKHTGKAYGALDYHEVDQVPPVFDEHDIGNQSYRIRFKLQEYDQIFRQVKKPTWTYEPRPAISGETTSDVLKNNSEYQQLLASLDPNEQHLMFFVCQDSFEVFRAARRLARERGFRTGWFPREAEDPLAFGPGGMGDETD